MTQHTKGPWQWEITPSGEVRLCTPDRGKLYVMGFERRGMQGAQPRFSLWGDGERGRRGGIMHAFSEAGGENHPDARLIAAAPDLLGALQNLAALFKASGMYDEEVFEETDAAISKATGEPQ